MKAYGSKRTHAGCKTTRSKPGSKIKVREEIKNHKFDRANSKRSLKTAI